MDSGLFRQKSLEKISSPEELHDYMRVTSPRLWMLLGAIAALLIGFIVYASTAKLENTVDIRVTVQSFEMPGENGEKPTVVRDVFANLPGSMKDVITSGTVVRIGEDTGKVEMMALMDDTEGDSGITVLISMDNPNLILHDGEYDAQLVVESTTPISFLWN